MSAVTFGRGERFRFVAARSLTELQSAKGPAVYAVTCKQDAVARPKAHTVVYFGETQDLQHDAEAIHKDLHSWWSDHGGETELFFFFHEMPGSSQYERASLQQKLVREYDPQGNH